MTLYAYESRLLTRLAAKYKVATQQGNQGASSAGSRKALMLLGCAAACLAAYYSEGNQAGRVPVDAAQVRFVKKPRGARPGKVVYTDQRTILAEPKREL